MSQPSTTSGSLLGGVAAAIGAAAVVLTGTLIKRRKPESKETWHSVS